MKPADCFLCGIAAIDEEPSNRGGIVKFADYQPMDPELLGHPDGLEYVCSKHLAAAQALAFKTSKEALADLQKQFGDFPEETISQPSWWRRLFLKY